MVLKKPGRRPTAPDSPEKSVPALALVGDSDEGVHGSHPQPRVAPAPSWVRPLGRRWSRGTAGIRSVAGWVGPRLSAHTGAGTPSEARIFRVPVGTGSGSY